MPNKFVTAVVAGSMLAPSVKAQEGAKTQDVEDTTKVEIVDVLTKENSNSGTEISLEDAKLQLKIDDMFKNLSYKDKKKINKIKKHYGEEKFMVGMVNIVKEVGNNLDEYGTFDSKGGYSLKEDSVKDLLKSEFSEYFKYKRKDTIGHILLIVISGFFGSLGTFNEFRTGRARFVNGVLVQED